MGKQHCKYLRGRIFCFLECWPQLFARITESCTTVLSSIFLISTHKIATYSMQSMTAKGHPTKVKNTAHAHCDAYSGTIPPLPRGTEVFNLPEDSNPDCFGMLSFFFVPFVQLISCFSSISLVLVSPLLASPSLSPEKVPLLTWMCF